MDLRDQKFGIEIELTGIDRPTAARVMGEVLGNSAVRNSSGYDAHCVLDREGRIWKAQRDGSIRQEHKATTPASNRRQELRVEIVSPICVYRGHRDHPDHRSQAAGGGRAV